MLACDLYMCTACCVQTTLVLQGVCAHKRVPTSVWPAPTCRSGWGTHSLQMPPPVPPSARQAGLLRGCRLGEGLPTCQMLPSPIVERGHQLLRAESSLSGEKAVPGSTGVVRLPGPQVPGQAGAAGLRPPGQSQGRSCAGSPSVPSQPTCR